MSRRDGFEVADVDTKYLSDAKMKRLWIRVGQDRVAMMEAVLVHLAVVLASWGDGEREEVSVSIPTWLDPSEAAIEALQAERLLDRTSRIPRRSWVGWFGPAYDRREKLRVASAEGNRRRWG